MRKKALRMATRCAALWALTASAAPPEDSAGEPPFRLLKPGVAEELSAELKAALVRRITLLEFATRISPANGEAWRELEAAWLRLGVGDFSGGKFAEANRAFEQAVAIQPGNFEASKDLAACLIKLGKHGDAMAVIDRALTADPRNLHAWVFLSSLLIQGRRFDEAEKALEKARSIDPASKDVLGGLGFLYHLERKLPEALVQLDLALKIEPNDAELLSNRGDAELLSNRGAVLYAMGDRQGAIDSRLRALQIDAENTKVRREVMEWLFLAGRWEEGVKQAREVIAREPESKTAWTGLAFADLKNKRWKEGVDEMFKARSLGQNDSGSGFWLAQGLMALGRFDEAEKVISEVLSSEPKNADALAQFGTLRRSQHRTEEAARYSEKALEIDPQNAFALGNRVSECMDAGLPEDTIRYAKRFLAIPAPPGDHRVWGLWLAIGLAEEKLDRPAGALEAFRKATKLIPSDVNGWEGVARVSKDYAETCAAARKAAELAPNDDSAQATLGHGLARLGRRKEAIAAFESVLAKFPGNKFAIQEMKELRGSLFGLDGSALPPLTDPRGPSKWPLTGKPTVDSSGATPSIEMARVTNWTLLADDFRGFERSPEMAEAQQKSVEAEPKNAALRSDFGFTLLALAYDQRSMRQAMDAEEQFRKAMELDPGNAETPLRVALALIAQKRFVEAESVCQHATGRNPKSAEAWLYLAQSRTALGRDSDAVKDFERAIALAPEKSIAWSQLIDSYSRMNARPAAEARIRRFLVDFPQSSAGWTGLGGIIGLQGRYDEAIEAFRKSIALGEASPNAWNGLGAAHQLQGKSAEAEKELRRATQEAPRDETIWANLANVYLGENKIPEAIDASRRALKLDAKNLQALGVLAQGLAQSGDLDGARAACDEIEDLSPDLARTLRARIPKQ